MSELNAYSDSQLAYIRNEIFARHGYIFTNEKYKEYFENKSWYVQDPNFKGSPEELNIYEKENVKIIQTLENSRKKGEDYLYRDYENVNGYNLSEYYVVYTEAFSNKSNAQNYYEYLDRKAIRSQIIEEDNLYKVRVGSAYDLETAKQISKEIEAKNIDTYILGYSNYYDSKLYSLERLIYNGYYSEFEEGYNEVMVELDNKPYFNRYKKLLEKLYEEYM